MVESETGVNRRGFLLGAAGVGAGALLTACTSNSTKSNASTTTAPSGGAGAGVANDTHGKLVTIGFSAPAADHGWTGAIARRTRLLRRRSTPTSSSSRCSRPTTSPPRSRRSGR